MQALKFSDNSQTRQTLYLVVAIVVVQLVWWFVINPLFHSSPHPDVVVMDKAQIAQLDTPHIDHLKDANWREESLTWSECCKSSYYAARMSFIPAANHQQDLALIPNVGADNYWVAFNGVFLKAEGQLQPSSYHALSKGIIRVPRSLVAQGSNELLIITARNSEYYTDIFRAYAGDYDALTEALSWRQFVMSDLRVINTAIPLMISMIALVLSFQARNRAFLLWLAGLALVWGLRNGFYIWETFPFSDMARRSYYAWLTNAMPLAWFGFLHSWASSVQPSKRWSQVLKHTAVVWLLCGAFITYKIYFHGVPGIESGERVIEIFGVVVTGFAASRFLIHLVQYRESRPWEAALFLLCMTTFAMEMAQYFFGQFGHLSSAHAASLFLIAFVAAIAARNIRLFESMEAFNLDLNQRLAASEAEIRDNYQQLEVVNREATLSQERERLLQDMHDGIGSQLVGLLAVVRGAPEDLSLVEQSLSETLDDLRLIIDSLDSATDDLATALGIFRSRVEPRLQAAGYRSTWRFDAIPMPLYCSPVQVLHLYRILQEAVSNVLKHANAQHLIFAATTLHTPAGLQTTVTVKDDGQWSEPANDQKQQGLKSMRRRARALGGELEIQQATQGTLVRIEFLLPTDQLPGPTNIGGVSGQ